MIHMVPTWTIGGMGLGIGGISRGVASTTQGGIDAPGVGTRWLAGGHLLDSASDLCDKWRLPHIWVASSHCRISSSTVLSKTDRWFSSDRKCSTQRWYWQQLMPPFQSQSPDRERALKVVDELCYPSSVLSSDAGIDDDIGNRLGSVRRILGAEVTSGLVSTFVTTRLDYCNSVLAGLPQSTIDPLQRIQNAAARLVAGTGTRDHITPVLQNLHWLPIRFRIVYKLCVLMHLVRVGRSPAYLSDMMTSVANLPGRERLRSSCSFRYKLPRLKLKFGERSFSFSGPKAWNSLPSNLQELTNTDTFKELLKTHLFKLAFGELE